MNVTTYCSTDVNTPAEIGEQLNAIEEALGEYQTTDANPCGGAAYYDVGESKPWRVLFSDGAACESFETAEEAIAAVAAYVAEMDAQV